jgi:hypothetical protein
MRIIASLLAAALVSCSLPVLAGPGERVFLLGESDAKSSFAWEIPMGQYEALPRWTPRDAGPALSVARAVEVGGAWISRRHPEVKRFEVETVSLMRAGCCAAGQERWFYHLKFQPVVEGQRVVGSRFIAVVLLDGKVVEPRSEKVPFR